MGVVNTTYTFTSTDTITSAKMNNIIDETTFTSDAIQGTTLQVVSPGKLAVNAGGITSNEMGANSVVTSAITDSNVTTAKLASGAVTQAKLGTNVVGNGPAFSAYLNTDQLVPNTLVPQIIQFNTELFDIGSCFNTSTYRFTPNIAGYYQINLSVQVDNNLSNLEYVDCAIRKNGSAYIYTGKLYIAATQFAAGQYSGSSLIYLNGSNDYIDFTVASNRNAKITGTSALTHVSGFLARSA